MSNFSDIVIAAKCAPRADILNDIRQAGLRAVELYISDDMLGNLDTITAICGRFPFRYSIHAPISGYAPHKLLKLACGVKAEAVIMHNIYWDYEWEEIAEVFKDSGITLCVENITTVHEPVKFMRKYGMCRCLDIEHFQMECAGLFEEELIKIMPQAAHIHLTGYIFGSSLWHTPVYHSREHNLHILDLLKESGYRGLVVSEARTAYQAYDDFKRLYEFYQEWMGRTASKKNFAVGQ